MSSYLLYGSLILVLWLIKHLVVLTLNSKKYVPYFPGPKPLPLLGNALDLPTSRLHEIYASWGKTFQSDILFASAFGKHTLILNKLRDAEELLERRARKYSDRPVVPILKFIGWDWHMAFLRYGKKWRRHRQICQQNFRPNATSNYRPIILKKAGDMLRRLLEDPADFERHSKMYSISIPMDMMYGYNVRSFDDPAVLAADEALTLATQLTTPTGTWINIVPALGYVPPWFPGAKASKIAARLLKLNKIVVDVPRAFVMKCLEAGTPNKSLVASLLRRKSEQSVSSKEEEEAMYNIAQTIYGAGSDTTISAVSTFFYVMATRPEIQRKAQAEIDRVVGCSRLPNFEDRALLPYIEAVYLEVLRFRPPVPIGVPHAVTEDDYYKGHFIPKGTTVISNIWAMVHDEELYPEPLEFKPERFLNEKGKVIDQARILAYGFGRRICVGQHVASDTTWIAIASILACFAIAKAKDGNGNEIEISDSYDDFGLVLHKSKFQCSIIPRSTMDKELIEKAFVEFPDC